MTRGIYPIEPGAAHPLGAVPDAHGVNFAIVAAHATGVELLLFAQHDDPEPFQIIPLDPVWHRTFHCWHVYVRGLRAGTSYAYRFDGPPAEHGNGDRFNKHKVLLDPYANAIMMTLWQRAEAIKPTNNVHTCMRGMVVDRSAYDWEGDRPLRRPMHETIIYELHVGGFTKSPSSDCRHPGTFAGLVEKIPYLQDLGITAVELLPVFAFDEHSTPYLNPQSGQPLTSFWGYDPVAHFAPHPGYCLAPSEGSQLRDFREMVKALHRAGIEVILDVVFNHTGEGDHLGPTISFKGIDNRAYYVLDPDNKQHYVNYSGCGNTCQCNHPLVVKFITDCLRYWVQEMHVDGFRFDEGSILTRGADGHPLPYPPVLWNIELDDALADTKIITEAWDAAGLYQVGSFPGYRWAEWNGYYRDTIRRFVRGDPGMVGAVASCIAGSAHLYQAAGRMPINSINFITCHDGFTLNDLVSYNCKHNEANGEDNRDGMTENWSWNCGIEGETTNAATQTLRGRQIKNFATILLLSQGVPMLLAGDEIRRTQHGNNNAYCQNNEISWLDWTLLHKHEAMFRFFKHLIAFRKKYATLRRRRFFTGQLSEYGMRDIDWHGCHLFQLNWQDPTAHTLAFTIWGFWLDDDMHVMLNMEQTARDFELPPLQERRWFRVIDTALPSPLEIAEPGQALLVPGTHYRVESHSVIVLISGLSP
jgi:isoamylase